MAADANSTQSASRFHVFIDQELVAEADDIADALSAVGMKDCAVVDTVQPAVMIVNGWAPVPAVEAALKACRSRGAA